ncbi:acyl-CoA dehydrogenase family protein [Burkholderia pseudomallei]|uniref:Acyl-CoA dehydrogenase domain protein n=4 Tax=pseudomallei group TaxID=111527 RepID=A2S5Z7_BURM9|nr:MULTISPECIES: acyl-CoA dehydrogenase family protein [pseudomallei group]ABM52575.1 acyl-CoA dehydrogenase domain protein [Burkholderia mallei SAVP1]ABN03844.1 acyl-CoA dehydrogenase domain protein [Burkholderia mallei NCTC 10229]ABN90460.1 acyl-CoA dehydrogenase domain protein [Burkholderia pseudomallei 1106a]ABO06008.1 acyl-CoA dehydrogenase domain protein [Burkholderia mallei NCTC 10247]AFR14347.1 acyl-CoA dehydrogenase domain-containing protein [Burkholderia pseudomallei BPC006]
MDLNFTAEEEAFRAQVQRFLADELPPRISRKVKGGLRLTRDDMREWHAILNARGWLASHWPREWGGPGWSVAQKFLFDNECAIAGAPRIVPFGVNMLGPVLIKYGSAAQKRHWLPRILDGTDWWCQGYSEPGAGSDLAAVSTSAVRGVDARGDHYIVNGQKTWTTLGHYANMIFCLVRTATDVRKQEGISFLLVDMNSPGVEVRPIVTLDGEHEVNEVFFTDVRVPAENRVGEENQGWTYAKYLLTYERTNIAGVGFSVAALDKLRAVAAKVTKNGRPLADDPLFAARLARVAIELDNMKTTNLRVLAAVAGGGAPGAESSMLKIRGTQIRQEISSLMRRAMGPYAQPFVDAALDADDGEPPGGLPEAASAAAQYFNNRKLSIFGGSNEIQKNIISKMMLGL